VRIKRKKLIENGRARPFVVYNRECLFEVGRARTATRTLRIVALAQNDARALECFSSPVCSFSLARFFQRAPLASCRKARRRRGIAWNGFTVPFRAATSLMRTRRLYGARLGACAGAKIFPPAFLSFHSPLPSLSLSLSLCLSRFLNSSKRFGVARRTFAKHRGEWN
jgi:hypothetical protein